MLDDDSINSVARDIDPEAVILGIVLTIVGLGAVVWMFS